MFPGRWVGGSLGIILLLTLGLGCAAKNGRQAVSGSVVRNGEPLKSGIITFFHVEGAPGPVAGALIRDGQFAISAEHGLEPGKYRVTLSAPEPGGILTPEEKAAGASPKAKEGLPAKYNSATELTAEVKADDTNRFDFKIE